MMGSWRQYSELQKLGRTRCHEIDALIRGTLQGHLGKVNKKRLYCLKPSTLF